MNKIFILPMLFTAVCQATHHAPIEGQNEPPCDRFQCTRYADLSVTDIDDYQVTAENVHWNRHSPALDWSHFMVSCPANISHPMGKNKTSLETVLDHQTSGVKFSESLDNHRACNQLCDEIYRDKVSDGYPLCNELCGEIYGNKVIESKTFLNDYPVCNKLCEGKIRKRFDDPLFCNKTCGEICSNQVSKSNHSHHHYRVCNELCESKFGVSFDDSLFCNKLCRELCSDQASEMEELDYIPLIFCGAASLLITGILIKFLINEFRADRRLVQHLEARRRFAQQQPAQRRFIQQQVAEREDLETNDGSGSDENHNNNGNDLFNIDHEFAELENQNPV